VKLERNHHCYVFNFYHSTGWIRATRWDVSKVGEDGLIIPFMDRLSELESMRRSIAMLNPRAAALDREEAMTLFRELQDVERRLRTLRDGLWFLLDDARTQGE
jgi:hypothetical protein